MVSGGCQLITCYLGPWDQQRPFMLSFPAQPWQTARNAVTLQNTRSSIASTISPITRRLYLSGYRPVSNPEELKRLGITHILSVLNMDLDIPSCIPQHRKLHIRVDDRSDEDISAHFDAAVKFINTALAENDANRVLVHCLMGVSRSATIICAYMIATAGMNAMQSIEFVHAQRRIVCPNLGFRRQLEVYAEKHKKPEAQEPVNWSQRFTKRISGHFKSPAASPRPAGVGNNVLRKCRS